jgi:hypothetical protein
MLSLHGMKMIGWLDKHHNPLLSTSQLAKKWELVLGELVA